MSFLSPADIAKNMRRDSFLRRLTGQPVTVVIFQLDPPEQAADSPNRFRPLKRPKFLQGLKPGHELQTVPRDSDAKEGKYKGGFFFADVPLDGAMEAETVYTTYHNGVAYSHIEGAPPPPEAGDINPGNWHYVWTPPPAEPGISNAPSIQDLDRQIREAFARKLGFK